MANRGTGPRRHGGSSSGYSRRAASNSGNYGPRHPYGGSWRPSGGPGRPSGGPAASTSGVASASSSVSNVTSGVVNAVYEFNGNRACCKCGASNHLTDLCPFESSTDLNCYLCNQKGHIGWNCQICCHCRSTTHNAASPCPNVRCFNCPGETHLAVDCPNMNRRPIPPPPPPL